MTASPAPRPGAVTDDGLVFTPAQAALVLDLLKRGVSDPDLWSREQRAAVTRLFDFRDGRAAPAAEGRP